METTKSKKPWQLSEAEADEVIAKTGSFSEIYIYSKILELKTQIKSLEENIKEIKSLIARKV